MSVTPTSSKRFVLGIGGFAAAALTWELLARVGQLDRDIFPPLSLVAARALELISSREFLGDHVVASLGRLIIASFLCLPIAAGLGIWTALSKRTGFFLNPIARLSLSAAESGRVSDHARATRAR